LVLFNSGFAIRISCKQSIKGFLLVIDKLDILELLQSQNYNQTKVIASKLRETASFECSV
jgi:hypothetical protein